MKFNLAHTIQILERTPLVFSTLLAGLPQELTDLNEGENTWSAYDIIGHLIHGEITDWIPRAEIILSDRVDKTFVSFDRFAQFENSKGKPLAQLLAEFKELRAKNIEILKSWKLTETTLQKTGVHPELGTVTLQQLLATWTIHDLNHLHQMTRVMVKGYKEEVGPWVAFNTLLQ